MRYKSLPESSGYAPTYVHSLEGREGLVYHCGSGVLGARVTAFAAEPWASVPFASNLERSCLEAEQNSDGCHGAMYFDIFLRYLLYRHAINPELPLKLPPLPMSSGLSIVEATGQPWVPHSGEWIDCPMRCFGKLGYPTLLNDYWN